MSHSVNTLNALMKYVIPKDGPISLLDDNVRLYKMLPDISPAERAGRKLLVAVELTSEGGITYGDGTAFAYEDTVDGVWGEAQLDAFPVVLNMQLSRSATDRLADNRNAFVDLGTLKTKSMYRELSRRAEISCFYGKSPKGLGTVGSIAGTGGTTLVVTWSAGQWASGFWSGRKGHRFEFRAPGTGTARAGHTVNTLVLQSVNWEARACTFTGNAAEIATVVVGDVCYFRGAYTNDMFGLDAQMTTSGPLFGIDNTVYDIYKGNTATLGANSIPEYMKALATPAIVGGLASDTVTFLNPAKFEAINSSVNNSNYRSSGDKNDSKLKIGIDTIEFTTQSGRNSLIPSTYVKEGDGFVFSVKDLKVYGTKKISFENSQGKGDYWIELPNNYGSRMQAAYEFAIMLGRPSQALKLNIP